MSGGTLLNSPMMDMSGKVDNTELDSSGVAPGPVQRSNQSFHEYDRLFIDLFTRIKSSLVTDAATRTSEQREQLKLKEVHGLYFRDRLLYVPEDVNLREDILYWHHDVPWCAHLGVEKTVKMVKLQFYWPGLDADVRKYIQTCYKCQGNKSDRRKHHP